MTDLLKFQDIQRWELGAQDGKVGRCHDLLFNDTDWTIRYLVADTRKWLPGRKVLISPLAVSAMEKSADTLDLPLTRDQIRNAPPLDSDAPVSRRYEIAFNRYYDWPNYWAGSSIREPHLYTTLLHRPEELARRDEIRSRFPDKLPEEETHLRSVNEILGYRLLTGDTDLGNIEDLLVDDESWVIRYLIVDARNWLPESGWLLISQDWVEKIDWADSSITVKLSGQQLKKSPKFDPTMVIDREYERDLHDFYGLPYYWHNQGDGKDRS